MKKNTLPIKNVMLCLCMFLFTFSALNSHAQACGGSGPSVCTPQSGLTVVGFYPSDTALPCVNDGQAYSQVISFLAPTTVSGYTLQNIQITSISNLPCGLCWASNSTSNTINGGGSGCVRVSGISNEVPGEYNVLVYAKATVSLFGIPITLGPLNIDSALGLKYYARVVIPGEVCPPVDTNSLGGTASVKGSIVTPAITGNTTICGGGSTTLTATGASYYGFAWSNGSNASSITVSSAGTYTVTVYDNCNSATASVNVTTATATITPSGPTTFCSGGSVTLTASAGTAYKWSNAATTQAIAVTASGSFTVTVTNGSCNVTSGATVVTVNKLPVATVTASGPTAFCGPGSVTLTAKAGAGYTWLWSNSATSEAITVSSSGSYVVTATAKGCSKASVAKKVTVTAPPAASITTSGSICTGGTETLTEKKIGKDTYLWSTTATTNIIKVTTAGTYIVTVTGTTALHCSASASKAVSCGAAAEGGSVSSADKTDGLNATENAGFQASVYPNPYSGQFNLKIQSSNTTDNVQVRIYDINGKMIEQKLNIAYGNEIMLGNGYAPGVYIVRVQQAETIKELRVVKAE